MTISWLQSVSSPQSIRAKRHPVVVVTGASAGVGRAAAAAFAQRGWSVALLARGRTGLEGARHEVEQAGGSALVIRVDVADPDAVAAASDRVVAAWGGIDVWVNNAMATVYAPVEEITPAEFRRVTEVTYLGQVHGTLAALKHMRRQGAGTIVQVGSALAYRSIPLQSAYCAAKAAVRGFTDSLRSELIHGGSPIRQTMVHLPAVNTPQFDWARSRVPRRLQPVPPIHDPQVAAEAILRAAHEAPRELWVGSPTVKAILGTMAAPGLLDRLLARRAWGGQMTGEPASRRPDNLFEPVEDRASLQGRFAPVSRSSAITARASLVRGLAGAVVLGAIAAAIGLTRRRSTKKDSVTADLSAE
jgi:NAD(P)-dependent dehydrogenase (short-subunit alcohol dehydrogenase family)